MTRQEPGKVQQVVNARPALPPPPAQGAAQGNPDDRRCRDAEPRPCGQDRSHMPFPRRLEVKTEPDAKHDRGGLQDEEKIFLDREVADEPRVLAARKAPDAPFGGKVVPRAW